MTIMEMFLSLVMIFSGLGIQQNVKRINNLEKKINTLEKSQKSENQNTN